MSSLDRLSDDESDYDGVGATANSIAATETLVPQGGITHLQSANEAGPGVQHEKPPVSAERAILSMIRVGRNVRGPVHPKATEYVADVLMVIQATILADPIKFDIDRAVKLSFPKRHQATAPHSADGPAETSDSDASSLASVEGQPSPSGKTAKGTPAHSRARVDIVSPDVVTSPSQIAVEVISILPDRAERAKSNLLELHETRDAVVEICRKIFNSGCWAKGSKRADATAKAAWIGKVINSVVHSLTTWASRQPSATAIAGDKLVAARNMSRAFQWKELGVQLHEAAMAVEESIFQPMMDVESKQCAMAGGKRIGLLEAFGKVRFIFKEKAPSVVGVFISMQLHRHADGRVNRIKETISVTNRETGETTTKQRKLSSAESNVRRDHSATHNTFYVAMKLHPRLMKDTRLCLGVANAYFGCRGQRVGVDKLFSTLTPETLRP
jgi:hypothetical protein